MQIVIDIDDIIYKDAVNSKVLFNEYVSEVAIAIISGTPLPKHHGRLIDADELKQELINKEWITDYDGDGLENIVNEAPTIIEGE